ncbi:hypothetical protein HMPREF0591_3890 [Mycobacterium parascrofulaceum ATCC BAA-614]|uniref:Uncharacterized protein n=1 Tax=Mycobacterium parascrofulaceum ATCC BAA-614 TaxID=525368 RepID=D5PCJ6_9MYCO|nr:hypothetical protein HMPREF0591_3890 [Mycobacterium parascrofulaceum ATCC BAA-614]
MLKRYGCAARICAGESVDSAGRTDQAGVNELSFLPASAIAGRSRYAEF